MIANHKITLMRRLEYLDARIASGTYTGNDKSNSFDKQERAALRAVLFELDGKPNKLELLCAHIIPGLLIDSTTTFTEVVKDSLVIAQEIVTQVEMANHGERYEQ